MKKFLSEDRVCLVVILFVSFVAISPMLFLGIPDGADLIQHLQFAATYQDSIFSKDFLPVWAASDNNGFGSIGVRFYPPLSSYFFALLRILAGNWYDAIWLNFLLWMFIGCVGIYFWAREWLTPKASTVPALLYIIAPYHLAQIYQMWLNAELVAAAVLPFCFLLATRICRRGRLMDVLLFAVAYSLLLLSHIPSIIIGSLSLAVYALILLDWSQYRKTFVRFFAAFALSVSATAFYWVKIVTEIDWVKHSSSEYSTGYYDSNQQLFPLYISAGGNYVKRVSWHFDASIILTSLLFLPAIIYLGLQIRKSQRQDRKIFFAFSATGLFALFMMSLPSSFVWQSSSILQKVQFPWRWLSVLSIVSVLAFAFAFERLNLQNKTVKRISTYLALLLIFSIVLFNLTQSIILSDPLKRVALEGKLANLREEQGCDCWWTSWAKSRAFERSEKVAAESRTVKIKMWKATEREFTIEAGEPTNIRVATFFYPYWQAQVEDQAVQIQRDEDGSILIPVEGKKSSVKLYFREPKFLKSALVLSLMTWLLLFGALISAYRNKELSNALN